MRGGVDRLFVVVVVVVCGLWVWLSSIWEEKG